MRSIVFLVILAVLAIITEQCGGGEARETRENHFRRVRTGTGSGFRNKISGWSKNINGRTLSRTGHAIEGGVRAADTIKSWFGRHQAME